MDKQEIKNIIECLIFVSPKPVSADTLSKILNITKKEIKNYVYELQEEYSLRGLQILEVANGYEFRTKPQYANYIQQLLPQTSHGLSQAALETLAIIAYRQPITRQEIENIRKVDVSGILNKLLEKNLIKIVGKKDVIGHPFLYATGSEFMRYFGLKSLDELPPLEDE